MQNQKDNFVVLINKDTGEIVQNWELQANVLDDDYFIKIRAKQNVVDIHNVQLWKDDHQEDALPALISTRLSKLHKGKKFTKLYHSMRPTLEDRHYKPWMILAYHIEQYTNAIYYKYRNKKRYVLTMQELADLCEVSLRQFYRYYQYFEKLGYIARWDCDHGNLFVINPLYAANGSVIFSEVLDIFTIETFD